MGDKSSRDTFRKICFSILRESSFDMTRGGGGDEDIEGGLRKFLGTRKGGFEKIRGGGGSKNLYTSEPTAEGGGS